MSTTRPPKALLTDVFGTVVDWRTTVTTHLTSAAHAALSSPVKSIASTTRLAAESVSWPMFAQKWRESYYHFTRTYDPDPDPATGEPRGSFKSIDAHHFDSLVELLNEHDISSLFDESEVKELSLVWHRLVPWPDSPDGLRTLSDRFVTATLSNGNTGLLKDLAAFGGLSYTAILSAEDFKAYKPHPNVYLGAARQLGLSPADCALVAAHLADLEAARGCGYQTIYIARPAEESWDASRVGKAKGDDWVDMWVDEDQGGFREVVRRFGIQPSVSSAPAVVGEQPVSEDTWPPKDTIERNAEQGTYHEGSSITGTSATGRLNTAQQQSVAESAERGTYYEDGSIDG